MAKKKKGPKFNNPHSVPNDTADEIRRLDNDGLIARASLEYNDWIGYEKVKKNDGTVADMREQIKDLKKEIEADAELVQMKEAYEKRKAELVSEEQARLEEEIKNELQPLQEDVKNARGRFRVAMDEISNRHKLGVLK